MPYQLSRRGKSYGPYTLEDLQRYVASGNIAASDWVKNETMTDWAPVQLVLQHGGPPPPPSAAPPPPPGGWMEPYAEVVEEPKVALYPLFPVSPLKFAVMSLFTVGFYNIYWAYKSWDRIAQCSGEAMMPWARAIFAGIWNFSYFDIVSMRAADVEVRARWIPAVLASCVIVLSITSYLHGGLGMISLLTFLPYLPVVSAIARINAKLAAVTEEKPNTNFTTANIVWLVFGSIILLFAVIGWTSDAVKALHGP